MKKLFVLALAATISLAIGQATKASILYSDTISYPNGNLTNGTTWFQTGAAGATPVQVSSGTAVLGTSGQDVYSPLSSIYTMTDGTSLYFGLTINVASAQATGDYFFHYAPTVGETSLFISRVFAKSTTGGFLLGYLETSGGAGAVVNYGTTVLSFSTSYNLVLSYNDVAGTLNDTASLYVNPTDSVQGNNTAYISGDAWGSTSAENHSVAEINLRQGTASSAPGLTVDNLIVATAFSDIVAPVPEPSTLALAGFGGLACFFALRRKR
jgi:hypothetical protein